MSKTQEEDFLDRLGQMFELQGDLQRKAYGAHPADITHPPERIQFIKDMILAAEDELHEALSEVGWKPWATSRHINEEALKGELVDLWHFFMNLCLVAHMTPDELHDRYIKKRLKNIARQQVGYDGITGKCPRCKRALDDEATTCHESPAHPGEFYCGEVSGWVDVDGSMVSSPLPPVGLGE